ncbi:MAG: helix-turn-helix domain-containing protein [Lachnospiraceae bacterium]|nr:helix-turn-helix domain-containing protein [Lachnospiraceae bacterium]
MYKVFLVDDDELILEELIDRVPWLDNAFEVVGMRTDPAAALGEIIEKAPDVVFCDLKMPGMDGNELMGKIKAAGVDCEFVMLSAYNDFEDVRRFFQGSGFDYILKPVRDIEMQLVLERLNSRLSKLRPQKGYSAGEEEKDEADEGEPASAFDRILGYTEEHYAEKLTLDSLAEEFGYSRNYICRLFQKNTGRSLNVYLTDLRMQHAYELLKKPDMLIKEVALQTGYSDYYHFFKVFKEKFGFSPKEMRDKEE